MKEVCKIAFKYIVVAMLTSNVSFANWEVDGLKKLGTNSLESTSKTYTELLGSLEKNGVEKKKIEDKIKTLNSRMSVVFNESKSLLEHIYTSLKKDGNLEAILAKRYLDWANSRTGAADLKMLNTLEGYLGHLEREIVQSNRMSTTIKVEFMQSFRGIVNKINEARKLDVAVRGDFAVALEASLKTRVANTMKSVKADTIKKLEDNSARNIFVVTVAGLVVLLAGVMIRNRRLKKKNAELENQDWGPYIRRKTIEGQKKAYESLKDIGVAMVESNGEISYGNALFSEMFKDTFTKKQKWEDFFGKNFKREKTLKGVHSLYKYLGDVTSDYVVQVSRPNEHGKRACFFVRFDSAVLAKIGSERVATLEKMKVNVLDILDDIISRESSLRGSQYIEFAEVDYANDLYVYMPEDHAKAILEKSLKAVFSIQSLKKNTRRAILNVKRKDKCLVVSAELPGIHLDVKDFSKKIIGDQTLSNIMREVEHSNRNFEITTVVKNVKVNGERAVSFELLVSDLENVKVEQREFSL